MKCAYWTFAGTLIIASVFFALSNRESIDIRLWPLFDFSVPTYVAVLGPLGVGFLSGGFWFWLRALAAKARETASGRRVDRLQRELDALNTGLYSSKVAVTTGKPCIPVATSVEPSQKQSGTG